MDREDNPGAQMHRQAAASRLSGRADGDDVPVRMMQKVNAAAMPSMAMMALEHSGSAQSHCTSGAHSTLL
jgi:hypothetical protein